MTTTEDTIEAYIKHIRNMCSMRDETLRNIFRKAIEMDPELLYDLEKILYKKEKIKLQEIETNEPIELEDWNFL